MDRYVLFIKCFSECLSKVWLAEFALAIGWKVVCCRVTACLGNLAIVCAVKNAATKIGCTSASCPAAFESAQSTIGRSFSTDPCAQVQPTQSFGGKVVDSPPK